jgi:ubiquinone/menaquinone biosynthesis C-methylase UbiE
VIGVDVAADAILHARAKYRAANVHFVVGACEAIPLAAGSIDVIVSFETIEHLVDHDAMMREFRRFSRRAASRSSRRRKSTRTPREKRQTPSIGVS